MYYQYYWLIQSEFDEKNMFRNDLTLSITAFLPLFCELSTQFFVSVLFIAYVVPFLMPWTEVQYQALRL